LFESDKVVAQQSHEACDHDHGVCVHESGAGHDHDHAPHGQGHGHDHGHGEHGGKPTSSGEAGLADHAHADHGHGEHDHEGHHHVNEHGHGHHHDHDAHPDHQTIEGFTSLSFASEGPFALRKFQNVLDNQMPAGVFRAKGILWFNESERRHVFHLAGKRFSIDDSDWSGPRSNQLVLIGRQLDHATLRHQLQACVARDAGKGFG
jgi:G3E family GTPase